MIKIRKFGDRIVFMCPGCSMTHTVDTSWKFNGSIINPTITPSILAIYRNKDGDQRCHSFIIDAKIRFLKDSSHKLKGQTVNLPEVEE